MPESAGQLVKDEIGRREALHFTRKIFKQRKSFRSSVLGNIPFADHGGVYYFHLESRKRLITEAESECFTLRPIAARISAISAIVLSRRLWSRHRKAEQNDGALFYLRQRVE